MSDVQTSSVTPRQLHPRRSVKGALSLPGDKSISHRAALLGLWTTAPVTITNFSDGDDCARSLSAVEALGATVRRDGATVTITAPERYPSDPVAIDCGNSGTTARLLLGLLSGMERAVELRGDSSLSQRPMKRVTDPLRQMGARFSEQSDTLPLTVFGGATGSLDYRLPVPSAQVKSAILLAALTGGGRAIVTEDVLTRDHTERMLSALSGQCEVRKPRVEIQDDPADPRKKNRVVLDDWKSQAIVKGGDRLAGGSIDIPGDPSTAAFYLAAAAIGKGEVTIVNHSLNPTRVAFLEHLRAIGCEVEIADKTTVSEEPRGSVTVRGADLKGRRIHGAQTAALIDEIPIIAALACFADGPTIIRDAQELRVKESDRIESVAVNLRKMGAKVGALEDGLAVESQGELQPADFESFGDHRIAMALSIAALFLPGASTLANADCVAVSCPTFYELLDRIAHK